VNVKNNYPKRNELINTRLKIVIPTHNRPGLVTKLVSSLAAASEHPGIEVVVVDDYSSLSVKDELLKLSSTYPLISFLFLEKNSGGAGARNAGAKTGRTKWVWFIDDDDFVSTDTVLSVLEEIDKDEFKAKLVFVSAHFIKKGTSRYVVPAGENIFKIFARQGNEVNTSCVIFDYVLFEGVGGWDGNLVAGQDTDLLLRAAEISDAHVLPKLFVDIVHHSEERITTNPRKQMKGKIQFIAKHYRRLHPFRLARYIGTLVFFYPYLRKVIEK
jgi:glycosyltransferase involved in cell wall biosynthesis